MLIPFGFERPAFLAMGWGIDRMLDCAGLVADLSRSIEATPLLTPWALVFGLLGLAWFAFLADRWRLLGPALAVPAVLAFGLDHPPDVLVADTTQAVAVRGPQGLALATGKPGSFATRVWAETYGPAEIVPAPGLSLCDSLGCIARSTAGFTVATVKGYDAFAEDCASVDLVVTHLYAPSFCRAETQVIDADDLARHGSYWLAWKGGRFEMRPSVGNLSRPWRAGQL
jgi:competence protein ComEC